MPSVIGLKLCIDLFFAIYTNEVLCDELRGH